MSTSVNGKAVVSNSQAGLPTDQWLPPNPSTKMDARVLVTARTVHEYFDSYVPELLAELRHRARKPGGRYHVVVEGEGGGEWTINLDSKRPSSVRGIRGRPTRTLRISAGDVLRLLQDEKLQHAMFQRGQLDVSTFLDFRPPTFVPANKLAWDLKLGFAGTFVKVDHKNNAPQSVTGAWSFIDFSEQLTARGLVDRDLNVPIQESGLGSLSDLASWLSGGWFVVDRVRFLVNNLRTTLEPNTMEVTLEPDTIVIDVEFKSDNPTLIGEGNAYLPWFFGIPVGWSDSAIPDVNITNIHVQFRLVPFVSADGRLMLHDIGVTFQGDLPTDAVTDIAAQPIRDGITSAFRDNFNTRQIRDALAGALNEIVGRVAGQPLTTWTDVSVDASGLTAWASA